MRALVTGGAGFIGSNLTREIVKRGWEVVVIDSLITGHMKNIIDLEKKITFFKGTVANKDLLERAMARIDIVFHLAALPSVPRSIEDPLLSHVNNVDGTFLVLLVAKQAGVKKVVYSSSSSIYGESKQEIKHEGLPAAPISPYGLMKYIGEEYCQNFTAVFGLPTVSLRYFNVFGPYQDPFSTYAAVIPKFISNALKGQPLVINGDGTVSRDFTYIENVVLANIAAATTEKAIGAYNIACGHSISLNELAATIERLVGRKLEIVHGPPRKGDIAKSQSSIERAKRDFGYKPKVLFADGLKRTFRWYRDNVNYYLTKGVK